MPSPFFPFSVPGIQGHLLPYFREGGRWRIYRRKGVKQWDVIEGGGPWHICSSCGGVLGMLLTAKFPFLKYISFPFHLFFIASALVQVSLSS